jgi:hypothetical protein
MDKLIGESFAKFYDFISQCLSTLWLSLWNPQDLVGKVFDDRQSQDLPNPLAFVILLSFFASILTQYMILLIHTMDVQSFITVLDSITWVRVIAYTLPPFLCIYVLSSIVERIYRIGGYWSPPRDAFLKLLCYAAGLQMAAAILCSVLVLILVSLREYLGGMSSWILDRFYPLVTWAIVVAGFRPIYFLSAKFLSKGWMPPFFAALGFTWALLAIFPASLLPFFLDIYHKHNIDNRGISILICDIDTKETCLCELPEKTDGTNRATICLKALIRNEGQEYYYIRRNGGSVKVQADAGYESEPLSCCISTIGKNNAEEPMIFLAPRTGELWTNVFIVTDGFEKQIQKRTGVRAIFTLCYATGQNLYSQTVSKGNFSAKLHVDWLNYEPRHRASVRINGMWLWRGYP